MTSTRSPMSSTNTSTSTSTSTSTKLRRALQVLAALSVLVVLFQFVTAGQLFPSGGPAGLHAAGAIVLHVVSGLAAVCAVVLGRMGRLGFPVTALAAIVFGYSFLQAAIGGYQSLYVHLPGAMLMAAGVVWLLVVVLRPAHR